METYLVGGAVRDKLLNKPVHEHDFVVVGETPESMLAQGYKQVGKDFPVFLHPKTHEEYALARKERKTALGYHGFEMDTDQSITLEEDLLRRDLTINAIAEAPDGTIIDPYNGQKDLHDKTLRHVSHAFIEDPLRVLRVARFQAYLPDFTIHPETQALMTTICNTPNELLALPKERMWLEVQKASKHPRFDLFWSMLNDCGALSVLNITLSDTFTQSVQHSPLTGVDRLLSACWDQDDISGILALNPPTNTADCMKVITSQKQAMLSPSDAKSILATAKRLDPFRRLERALMIIESMPENHHKALWLSICKTLSKIDITKVIDGSEPAERQALIEEARLQTIETVLKKKD